MPATGVMRLIILAVYDHTGTNSSVAMPNGQARSVLLLIPSICPAVRLSAAAWSDWRYPTPR